MKVDRLSKKTQIPNMMEIRPVGAELFHADRRTDMAKLMVAFRNFANSPKNLQVCSLSVLEHFAYYYSTATASVV